MDEIFPKHEQKLAQLFDTLSERELVTMIDLLKRVGHKATKQ